MSIRVIASFAIKQEKLTEFLEAAEQTLVAPTRGEPGCIEYAIWQNLDDPTRLTMLEEWESEEHLKTHLAQPSLQAAVGKLAPMAAEAPTVQRLRKAGVMSSLTPSLAALLVFVGWSVLLVLGIGAVRASQVLSGAAQANSFPSGTPHGSDVYWRLNRAHVNSLEFLPLFGAVVLTAAVVGLEDSVFDRLAWVVPVARIGQSVAHISSGSNLAVNLRFGCFLVQLACVVGMGLCVAGIL